MPQQPNEPAAELPIWKGRRGVVNTVMCLLLGVLAAFAAWSLAERLVIVPACTDYAGAHGLTYADFKLVGVEHASTVVCLLTRPDGLTRDVYLNELVSSIANLGVELAMSLEFTVPGFAVLFALARVWLHVRGARAASI